LIATVLVSIPSPSTGQIQLGPLHLRAYGLMIALGVLAAVWLGGRRLEERGVGTREDMSHIALWAVPAGVIGSRLYHVITDWRRFQGQWLDAFKIWEGGLGIWGGIGLGVAVGIWVGVRRGIPLQGGLSAITPALPLAQAIGRWGNWWNQELFGRPTTLPWGLEIDPRHRPEGYEQYTTFHPTFLYESLWCLFLCGALIWIDRRFRPRGTELLAMYVAGYTFMRFWIERLRVDPASQLWGWRVNEVVSLVVFTLAVSYLIVSSVRTRHRAFVAGDPSSDADADTAATVVEEGESAESGSDGSAGAETELAEKEPASAEDDELGSAEEEDPAAAVEEEPEPAAAVEEEPAAAVDEADRDLPDRELDPGLEIDEPR
jgi:prolipoprotein diacylglyceryl transferase